MEQYIGKPDERMDWTGWRTKEALFSDNDRWHQDELYDLYGRLVRKADSILSKGDDVVVCLPGARIEHTTEREREIK